MPVAPPGTPAGYRRRGAAAVLDLLPWTAAPALLVGLDIAAGPLEPSSEGCLVLIGGAVEIGIFAAQGTAIAWRGQSFGKWIAGVRVERAGGGRSGFLRGILLRSWVPTLVVATATLFTIGMVYSFETWLIATCVARLMIDLPVFTRSDGRTPRDLLAGTCVVAA